jgi:hypothetical protein
MNRGRVGEERRSKEMDRCPLTKGTMRCDTQLAILVYLPCMLLFAHIGAKPYTHMAHSSIEAPCQILPLLCFY